MSKKVLIADDEPELREVIKDLLEIFHLDISLARDGQDAIDQIKLNSFDLIISDQKMPKKSGLDVLVWMRTQKIQTPFLIQTGHGQRQLKDEAAKYDVLAVLDKPWDQDELLKYVKEALHI